MSNRYLGGFITNTPTQPTVSSAPGMWTLSQVSQATGNGIWPPTAYPVTNSLRFRSSASAYLNRTPSSTGSRTTWTFSAWVKRGVLSASEDLLSATTGSSTVSWFRFNTDDTLQFVEFNGSSFTAIMSTSAVYRDPSSWYHIVLDYDSTQATATNRVRIYVNGVQQTLSITTSPSLNMNSYVNSTGTHTIAKVSTASSDYFDGYLADINFIDGQALTPSSFGQISTITGVWQPIAYTGTYGTNGFKLNFSNGTSTTTLGYDSSGNSNNWTTNNISLTAGSTYDWMLDSPTPLAGTSYGVGNYCVLNPLDVSNSSTSSANLNAITSNVVAASRGTISASSGKWYWEVTTVSGNANAAMVGVCKSNVAVTNCSFNSANGWYYFAVNGYKYNANSGVAYGATFTTNDVIGVALDLDAGTLVFYKNGVSQGTAYTGLSGPLTASYDNGSGTSGSTGAHNFGQRPFSYTPPTGYKSLCTYNLPAASIVNGASYMAATTYTGNGSTQSITNTVNGVSFQPDFVWIKSRGTADNHQLQDSVRGATKRLFSNLTDAESTDATSLTSFNSNGFSLGNSANYNGNGYSFIAWNWKASGTAVSNTAGSITSQVSANTTAGFSVVTYTGNGVNTATVGHGLGIAPSFIISKRRDTTSNWGVYSAINGAQKYLLLNTTDATQSSASAFYAVPTATVMTPGDASFSNVNGNTYVAYCFAAIPGYSAFGSYTGNGSADGPFVYCGFRPRYVMFKRSDSTGDWYVWDTSRSPYNKTTLALYPNYSIAEVDYATEILDIVSNGFKLRTNGVVGNSSGATYIYACFAENPFQNALAR